MYVRDIQKGTTVSNVEPVILRETAATAHVDGNNVLGPVTGNFCMNIAMQKAKEAGVGWVVAKGLLHQLLTSYIYILTITIVNNIKYYYTFFT